ncbi:hypothetical protein [Kocuria sp. UCD-OTCP]|uniref:hypothetical protein n=1 Tax=Kocuria sp. UCD-OTCP TaxID=1292021 RepID=UPI000362F963|nr:hypothetical protein [Kocuria sp. UCD-OTCP]EYT48026.1 hypothetical protein H488_0116505 [Kocuria sp. UCD-OTCP]
MANALIMATTGAGSLTSAVATVGLWLSIRVEQVPDPAAIALLVVGVVLLAIGFTAHFEHQSRLGTAQMETQLQVRRRELQALGIIHGQAPQRS